MVVEPKCEREMCSLRLGTSECKLFDDEHSILTPSISIRSTVLSSSEKMACLDTGAGCAEEVKLSHSCPCGLEPSPSPGATVPSRRRRRKETAKSLVRNPTNLCLPVHIASLPCGFLCKEPVGKSVSTELLASV